VTQPPTGASGAEKAWAARPEAVEPRRAAQAFEALLLAQILERAQQPVLGGERLGAGSAGPLYRSWFAQEVAERMAARGGFGLADAIEAQLARSARAQELP